MRTMVHNNNREQIINLINSAQTSIQIAVSWFTDEFLIAKLTETARNRKVEVLLSCDALNVWRFASIRALQNTGAKVLKTGAEAPGLAGFMHAKFIIIDGKVAFGGSFNFTDGANYNYENFKKYADHEVSSLLNDYKVWWSTAKDYTVDFENPESVKRMVIQKFALQEQFRERILSAYDNEQKKIIATDFAEREAIIKAEMVKDSLRSTVNAIQSTAATISKAGTIVQNSNGVNSRPHRFYGGNLLTQFHSKKVRGSFSLALIQKRRIEKHFSFLKCRIVNDTLICRGKFQPEGCRVYDVKIEFRAGTSPQVYILSPEIKPAANIHIYHEGSLCLFYPGDLKWKTTTSIAELTIPWIFEWILYYELYLRTGAWEGENVSHRPIYN